MGYFGAKHCDKHLLIAFVVSCSLWFVYMSALNYETLEKIWNKCDTDDAGKVVTAVDQSTCHRTEQEKEMCQPPVCDTDQVKFDMRHPYGEVLPDCVITVLLALGIIFGYKLCSSPSVDTNARQVGI